MGRSHDCSRPKSVTLGTADAISGYGPGAEMRATALALDRPCQ